MYYWDYSIGVFFFPCLRFHPGQPWEGGRSFTSDLSQAEFKNLVYAFLAGTIFNLSNVLLVTVIDIAGMAIAFPIGVGLALVLGVISGYLTKPSAIQDTLQRTGLYRVGYCTRRTRLQPDPFSTEKNPSARGIVLSVLTGVFMGFFYPLLVSSISPTLDSTRATGKLTPYTAIVLFSQDYCFPHFSGIIILMRKPLTRSGHFR